jgi:tetratricopeptide (TPR) repeat protein
MIGQIKKNVISHRLKQTKTVLCSVEKGCLAGTAHVILFMKTVKLKHFYLSIIICVVVSGIFTNTLVYAVWVTKSGIEKLNAGIEAYEKGKYDDAIFKLEMAVYQIEAEDKDKLWYAHFYLGLSYHLTGNEEDAIKEFQKAQGILKTKLPDSHIHSPKVVKLFKDTQLSQTGNVWKGSVSVILETKLRSTPRDNLSVESVKSMLKDKGFYDSHRNNSASGFHNDFKLQNAGKVVYDSASGLMWQQSGSDKCMEYRDAKAFVTKLNSNRFAGYNDWRLPTLEEAMSLIESSEKSGDLFIDPVFDSTQRYIWTSDMNNTSRAWVVYFGNGDCSNCDVIFYSIYYGRAVR